LVSARAPYVRSALCGLPVQVKVISNIKLGVEHISIIRYLIVSFSVR